MIKKNIKCAALVIVAGIASQVNGMENKQGWLSRLISFGKKPRADYSHPITVSQQEEWPIPADATGEQRIIYEKMNEKIRERNEQERLRSIGVKETNMENPKNEQEKLVVLDELEKQEKCFEIPEYQ